jgi:putative transposase
LYKWKRRVAGMGIVELSRLRELQDENKKLKALVADLTLDKHMLEEVLRKSSEASAQACPGAVSVQ